MPENTDAIKAQRTAAVQRWKTHVTNKYYFPPRRSGSGPYVLLGDSHSWFWANALGDKFSVCWVGTVTAHAIRGYHKPIQDALAAHPGKPVFFMIGELDCRIAIHLASWKKMLTEDECVAWSIKPYMDYLDELKNVRRYVVSVTPTGPTPNIYNAPVYPEYEQRKAITLKFNVALQAACAAHGFPFVNVYPDLIDGSGNRKGTRP